jgi:hypothetical protein
VITTIQDARAVKGFYCGERYYGRVLTSRVNQAHRAQILYTVVLDERIIVYGQERMRITVESDSDYNTIEVSQ